jgi:hypothetical protein
MIGYYEKCEEARKIDADVKYMLAKFSIGSFNGTPEEAEQYLESIRFKTADEIVAEQQKAAQKAMLQNQQVHETSDGEIIYDVYDARGYKFVRDISFDLVDENGDIVTSYTGAHTDKNGKSYRIVTLQQEKKEEWDRQQYELGKYRALVASELMRQLVARNITFFKQEEEINKNLTEEERKMRYLERTCDWDKQEKLIHRIFRTSSFSKRTFNEILKDCCNTELGYSGKSDFFSLSYDFERDLHYATLTQSESELQSNPVMYNKFKQEFDIKRNQFLSKIYSGDLGCDMRTDAKYRPTTPKPIISQLTVGDYQKPENQVMYSQIYTPQLATENMFIPKELGCKLDPNNQPIPNERTVGFMTVDDDTGEVVSKQEFDVPIDATALTDDQLADVF